MSAFLACDDFEVVNSALGPKKDGGLPDAANVPDHFVPDVNMPDVHNKKDAGVSDAGGEAAADAAIDAADAAADAADAAGDAGDSGSSFCGDGIRDPQTEECDDGVVSQLLDSCTSVCTVRDLLLSQPMLDGATQPARTLGTGRHPVGAGASGFAVAWIEPKNPVVRLTTYDLKGVPSSWIDTPSVGTTALTGSAPVVAALPNGKYAVAFTDFGGDGDEEGIALRLVSPNNLSMGAPAHANVTTAYSQFDPDVLWLGNDLLVAWVDGSDAQTGPDIRYRTFDATMKPTSNELTLAGTSGLEMDVSP